MVTRQEMEIIYYDLPVIFIINLFNIIYDKNTRAFSIFIIDFISSINFLLNYLFIVLLNYAYLSYIYRFAKKYI